MCYQKRFGTVLLKKASTLTEDDKDKIQKTDKDNIQYSYPHQIQTFN